MGGGGEITGGGGNEAASDVCQVIFQPDNPEFSSTVPTNDTVSIDPPAGDGAAPSDQATTKTATPESAIPMAIGISNQVSN